MRDVGGLDDVSMLGFDVAVEGAKFSTPRMIHAGLVAAIVSLGDQSFLLTVIFGTWCPFQGIRDAWGASIQRILVWFGVVLAFTVRALLIAKEVPKMELLDQIFGVVASAVLILLTIRVLVSLSLVRSPQSGAEGEEVEKEQVQHNPNQDRCMNRYAIAAFITSFLVAFVIFPGGQTDRFILQGAKPGMDLIIGGIWGYAVATLFAVIFGSILERTVPVKRLLLCNAVCLTVLCLWVGSATFMYFHQHYLAPKWRAKLGEEADGKAKEGSLMQSSFSVGLGHRLMGHALDHPYFQAEK